MKIGENTKVAATFFRQKTILSFPQVCGFSLNNLAWPSFFFHSDQLRFSSLKSDKPKEDNEDEQAKTTKKGLRSSIHFIYLTTAEAEEASAAAASDWHSSSLFGTRPEAEAVNAFDNVSWDWH